MSYGTLIDLMRTREELTKHGWGQNHYYDGYTDCFCLSGAVREATKGDNPDPMDSDPSDRGLNVLLRLADQIGWVDTDTGKEIREDQRDVCAESQVIRWNDSKGRTIGEVLAVVDRAIEKESKP